MKKILWSSEDKNLQIISWPGGVITLSYNDNIICEALNSLEEFLDLVQEEFINCKDLKKDLLRKYEVLVKYGNDIDKARQEIKLLIKNGNNKPTTV